MTRELVTLNWCDICAVDSVKREGTSWTVSVGLAGKTPRLLTLEVCEEHAAPLVDLSTVADHLGRRDTDAAPVRKNRAKPAPVSPTAPVPAATPAGLACPIDGCGYAAARPALRAHTRNVHDRSLDELTGVAGMECPSPDCSRMFGRQQAVTIHVRSAHPDLVA